VWELLEDLADVLFPVFDAKGHHSAVDVIEGVVVVPLFVDIINDEADIWWDAARYW